MGCRFLLQGIFLTHGLLHIRLLSPRDFPGKNNGLSSHFLFQGIFPTQASSSCLLLAGRFFTIVLSGPQISVSEKIFFSHIVQLPIAQDKNSFYSDKIILYSLLLTGLSDRALSKFFLVFFVSVALLRAFFHRKLKFCLLASSPFCLSSGATSMCSPLLI